MPTETERVEVDQRDVNALVEQAERAFLGALEGLARVAEAAGVPPDKRGTTVCGNGLRLHVERLDDAVRAKLRELLCPKMMLAIIGRAGA